MAHDKFDGTTGFALDGGIKDASFVYFLSSSKPPTHCLVSSHIRRLTAEHNSPMPAIDIAHQHLLTARAIHTANKQAGIAIYDTLDWSGMIAGARVAAGLDGLDSQKVWNSSAHL